MSMPICGHERRNQYGVREVCTLPPDHLETAKQPRYWATSGATPPGAVHHYEDAEKVERARRPPVAEPEPRPEGTTAESSNVVPLHRAAEEEAERRAAEREAAKKGHRVGRSTTDLNWHRVRRQDPDAWKPPDDAERALTPDAYDPPTNDVAGYQAGAGEGRHTGMASVEEVKAAAANVRGQVSEAIGGAHVAMLRIDEAKTSVDAAIEAISAASTAAAAADERAENAYLMAGQTLTGAGHEAAITGMAHLTTMRDKIQSATSSLVDAGLKVSESVGPLTQAASKIDPEDGGAIAMGVAADNEFEAYTGVL